MRDIAEGDVVTLVFDVANIRVLNTFRNMEVTFIAPQDSYFEFTALTGENPIPIGAVVGMNFFTYIYKTG